MIAVSTVAGYEGVAVVAEEATESHGLFLEELGRLGFDAFGARRGPDTLAFSPSPSRQ